MQIKDSLTFFARQVDGTIEHERLSGLERDNAVLMAEVTSRLRVITKPFAMEALATRIKSLITS